MKIYNSNYYDKKMYINNLHDNNDNKLSSGEKSNNSGKSDRVELSIVGTKIKEYTDKIGQLDKTRASEIEDIKSKIQSGKYSVSSQQLADKIIEKLSLNAIAEEDE